MDVFVFLLGGVDFFLSLPLTSAEIGGDVDVGVGDKLVEGIDMGTLVDGPALTGLETGEEGLEGIELCGVGGGD